MKPAPFRYQAAGSLDEALGLLAEHGPDAAVLAGGQSLVVDLRYRTARPGVVVDINRTPDLDRVERSEGRVRIGPLVRHDRFAARPGGTVPVEGPLGVLMARITPWIGHPPIRARGTLAGSVAWGHPCAEWGALTAGLGGRVEVRTATGSRVVAAPDWYVGPCRTDRRADEIVAAVDLPELADGTGVGFAEHRRSAASFALVAAVATVSVVDGIVDEVHIGLAGAGPTPRRAAAAEAVLVGRTPTASAMAEAVGAAAGDDADPVGEPHASVPYRRHVVGELVRRALYEAVGSGRRRS